MAEAMEVVPLTESDIPNTIEIIQQAFADDPYFKWAFDQATFNSQRNHDSLTARCLWGINNALFFVAKDTSTSLQQNDTLGVSCWLPPRPPGTLDTWTECASNWLLSLRQLLTNIRHLGRGGLNVRRYAIWKARQREAQEAIWDDPRGYYFCNIVAVASRARGRGVGRKLFEVVTDEADKRGLQCYLESSNEVPNVEIYRRLGFEMRLRMECRDGEDVCMLYCMTREPRPKA